MGRASHELGQPGEGWLPGVKGQMGVLEDREAFRELPGQKRSCSLWDFLSTQSGLLLSWIALTCFAAIRVHD